MEVPGTLLLDKKRKGSKFAVVLKKLLGKKHDHDEQIKSQISLPTPTKHLESVQRAVSLPTQHASRTAALRSHKPSSHISEETFLLPANAVDIGAGVQEHQHRSSAIRHRRASMPNTHSMTPEPFAEYQARDEEDPQQAEEATHAHGPVSNSNVKRRSSADALQEGPRDHRMSPIQWRHYRKRSDEIRYWRESVAPEIKYWRESFAPTHGVVTSYSQDANAKETSDADTESDSASDSTEPHTEVTEPPVLMLLDSENRSSTRSKPEKRGTFDFGTMAVSMNNQEEIPIDDRVLTLEVKLMDFEYAISKLQARSSSPGGKDSSQDPLPKIEMIGALPSPEKTRYGQQQIHSPEASDHGAHSTTSKNTASTAATAQSLRAVRDQATNLPTTCCEPSPAFPPTTKVHSESPTPKFHPPHSLTFYDTQPQEVLPRPARNSITSITIDHYATLITLIRREQSARIRIEEQVADLQRELFLLKAKAQVDDTSIGEDVPRRMSPASRTERNNKTETRGRSPRDSRPSPWTAATTTATTAASGSHGIGRKSAKGTLRPVQNFDESSDEDASSNYEGAAGREWDGFHRAGPERKGLAGLAF